MTKPPERGEDVEKQRRVHITALAGSVYTQLIARYIDTAFEGYEPSNSAVRYARDLLERLDPRDPMEEMLAMQALLAHARTLSLTLLAAAATESDRIRILSEYAEKASNTYRRLMLAFVEYRRPPRTSIGQANIAQQHVVMTGGTDERTAFTEAQRIETAPPALPPVTGGLAALRAANSRTKPWAHSTGPKTAEGKSLSRMNAWKHGERSRLVQDAFREID